MEKEKYMSIGQSMLPEYDQEIATTRRVLERVPLDKADWKPHEKSMSMAKLANHLRDMAAWMTPTIQMDSLDIGPDFVPPPPATNTKELLSSFDKAAAEGREALAGVSDDAMMKPWSLLMGGKAVFTMPRIACVRGMILNHIIHHRGQLSVYLRLNDIPVPAIYGPSADEQGF
jgi:uncharacterized damage-inducible protein DinB